MSRDLSPTSIEAFDCSRLKIAIVQSSYHTDITDKLKNAAIESLKKHGVLDIQELLVPGAFELIYGTQKLLHSQSGIDVAESGWDSEMICYPNVFECDGQIYLLYNGNEFGKFGFGLAKLVDY
jgi:hypothetical protein